MVRKTMPLLKSFKEFEYGFKIRDKENPKNWCALLPWDGADAPVSLLCHAYAEGPRSLLAQTYSRSMRKLGFPSSAQPCTGARFHTERARAGINRKTSL